MRWRNRPEGSNWGDFGPDDELGRVNLLTPEAVKRGLAEAREGLVFCLSLPLDLPGGNVMSERRHPPRLRPTEQEAVQFINFPNSRRNPAFPDVINDDAALIWLQYSSQWDALAHIGRRFDADGDGEAEIVYYNGFRAGDHVIGPVEYRDDGEDRPTGRDYTGVRALGVERMAERGMQGRGVMVDLRAHFGDARQLVGYDELMRVMDADAVTVEPGDMVCLHTGLGQRIVDMKGWPDRDVLHESCSVLAGRDERLLQWISDSGLVALIADNYAVEENPARPGEGDVYESFPLHQHCLFKLGIPLAELWYLTELAGWLRAQGRSRFLLTAPPLRLPGAVGSPVTPIATV